MAKRNRKRKPEELISFTSRISVPNREWIRKHSEMMEMSQAAWFDALLTSLRQAEASMETEGGLFDVYSQKIDSMLERVIESKGKAK